MKNGFLFLGVFFMLTPALYADKDPLRSYSSGQLFMASVKRFAYEMTETPRHCIKVVQPYAPTLAKISLFVAWCVLAQKIADASRS